MGVRKTVVCVAAVLAAAASVIAYRQITAGSGCAAGMAPMNLQATATAVPWTACSNRAGTTMIITNRGTATLLVSPQDATTLAREPSGAGAGTPEDVAGQELSTAGHPSQDLQARGLGTGWLYLGPAQAAVASGVGAARTADGAGTAGSPVAGAAAVTVASDFYATARWALDHSVAGWADGQNSAGGTRPTLLAARGCASRLSLSASYRQKPPELGDVVRATVTDSHCAALLRVLAPVDASVDIAYGIADMADQFARTLPAGGWPNITDEAMRIFRGQ